MARGTTKWAACVTDPTIEGWMGARGRRWLARQASRYTSICEVGVWKGRSTKILATYTKGTVYAVDHWRGAPEDAEQAKLYGQPDPDALVAEFRRNLKREIRERRVVPLRGSSVDAARWFTKHHVTFDLVFIDADHTYEAVRADIAAYLPLVRPGGRISGHDFKVAWPGVMRAVEEAFPDGFRVSGNIWYVDV